MTASWSDRSWRTPTSSICSYQVSSTETNPQLIQEVASEAFGKSLQQMVACKFKPLDTADPNDRALVESLGLVTSRPGPGAHRPERQFAVPRHAGRLCRRRGGRGQGRQPAHQRGRAQAAHRRHAGTGTRRRGRRTPERGHRPGQSPGRQLLRLRRPGDARRRVSLAMERRRRPAEDGRLRRASATGEHPHHQLRRRHRRLGQAARHRRHRPELDCHRALPLAAVRFGPVGPGGRDLPDPRHRHRHRPHRDDGLDLQQRLRGR